MSEDDKQEDKSSNNSRHVSVMLLIATFVLIVALFLSAVGAAGVQILSGTIPEFELNAWRFGVQFIIMIPITIYRKCDIKVPSNRFFIVGLNIVLLYAYNVLIFTSVIYLPLGLSDGLINTFVIAGNAVLSICIKADRKLILYIAALVSIAGSVLMIQPDFIFSGLGLRPPPIVNWTSSCKIMNNFTRHEDINQTVSHSVTEDLRMGYMLTFSTSGVLVAYYHGLNKMVKDIHPLSYAFWAALIGAILSVVLMLIFEEPVFPHFSFCIGMLILHCLGTTAISLCTPWSLQYIRPTVCSLVCASRMVIMVIFQYTIMRDIKPGLQNWWRFWELWYVFLGWLEDHSQTLLRT